MKNKNLLIGLVVMIGAIAILGFKVMALSNGSAPTTQGSSLISLSTNPNPPKIGQTTFVIEVKDQNGKPIDNAKVAFDLNMTTMNMGTQKGEATPQGNGQYAANGRLSMGGPWAVKTSVTMPTGEVVSKDFTITVY